MSSIIGQANPLPVFKFCKPILGFVTLPINSPVEGDLRGYNPFWRNANVDGSNMKSLPEPVAIRLRSAISSLISAIAGKRRAVPFTVNHSAF